MAYYLTNRLNSADALPKNFIHTFLLRAPHKSVYSLYKMSLNTQLTGACPVLVTAARQKASCWFILSCRERARMNVYAA